MESPTGHLIGAAFAATAVLLGGLSLRAQPQAPAAPPAATTQPLFRGGVDLIVVEAHVVDGSGATARGLSAADFQVSIGGRPREIVSAELVEYENAPAVPLDPGISTNVTSAAARTILLIVDQASLRPEARPVLESAKRWVASLGPGDRVGLVTLPGGPRVEFTTEHHRVIDLLGQIAGAPTARPLPATLRNVSTYEGLRISEGDTITLQLVVQRECRRDPACLREIEMAARDIALDAQYRVQTVLGPLRSLIQALRLLPGPKHAVLISSGWPIGERVVAQETSSIAAEAALSNVTIHSFTAEQWATSAATTRPSTTASQDRMLLLNSVEMMSGATGGRAARLYDDGETAFKVLKAGLAGYYRLGVKAEAEDLDGKARTIAVKVKRPGVTLETHRKVMAGGRGETPPADPTEALQAAVARAAPATDLDLRCTSYVLHDENNGRDVVRVMVAGDVARAAAGQAKTLAVIYDLEGRPVANGGQLLDIATGAVSRFQTVLNVRPGSYRLRVAVRDADGRIGTIERGIEARWIKSGDAETTGLVLYRVPATPGSRPEPLLDTVTQGDRIVAQVALGVPAGKPAPAIRIDLTREGEPTPVLSKTATVGQTPAGVTLAQEGLPPALLTPGRYTLKAAVQPGATSFTRSFRVEAGK